jgi:hypothetical protein
MASPHMSKSLNISWYNSWLIMEGPGFAGDRNPVALYSLLQRVKEV